MKTKPIILVTILALGQFLCFGQSFQPKKELARFELKSKQSSQFYEWKTGKLQESDPDKGITIESSFPKGGGYTDSAGRRFAYRIFWYRVINKTSIPLELTVNFPVFATHPSPDYDLRIFLPPDTMTLAKEVLYSYGVASLESFFEGPPKPTRLQRTINPEEEFFFYIAAAAYGQGTVDVVRARLDVEGQDLFYKITGLSPELDSVSIPCGHLIAKK